MNKEDSDRREEAMTPLYLDYFGLADAPFSIAPNPRYLFMSAQYREALAHLLYGVKSDDGFVVLTGEIGTGKTTVCRCLLEQLPAQCDVAVIFNPKLSVLELLATICEEFGIAMAEPRPGVKTYIDRINAWLLAAHAQGRMAVLIIDEAQSLGAEVLEQLRLLTNLETNRRKLLRILLLGQPQLRELLARPDMAQLAQRIVARYHLEALSRPEMIAYVLHRLAVTGARADVFSAAALDRLHGLSGGVPRLVNIIADRALLGAYVAGKQQVDRMTLQRAAGEVLGQRRTGQLWRYTRAAGLGLGVLGATAVAVAAYVRYDQPLPAVAAPRPSLPPKEALAAAALPAGGELDPLPAEAGPPPAEPVPAASPAPAPAPAVTLSQGSQGAAVVRLRQDLARLRGAAREAEGNPVFDGQLAEEVRHFQAAEGLQVDGIVGPKTWLHLERALGAGEPRKDG